MNPRKFDQRQMAESIKHMSEYFQAELGTLTTQVKVSTDRFGENDVQDFHQFLQQLQRENMEKLAQFWDEKASQKTVTFELHNEKFQVNFQQLLSDMATFKNNLTQFFTQAKRKELYLEDQIESMIQKKKKMQKIKLSFKLWKDWVQKRKAKQEALDFSDRHYTKTLSTKCLVSWRAISYKPAYEEKIYKSSETDINNVQRHYLEIIHTLKNKIKETDDLLEVKKQAKSEFAYSLSKNMMKAISNLSMEVMSLNQMTLQDQRIDTSETQKFISQINEIVNNKCQEINELRDGFRNNMEKENAQSKRPSLITFSEPNPRDDPLSKVSLYRNDY